ncbi:PREDICTED: mitochondrial inner membrane protease subunit 1 isoform X2 [Pygoscelis adeliae]|uniref:mitochondrial inner membrane protease subunit 1 isoform X2 n=1 Tax=Pygoscelis adeliae TaxID=9238 RepID=UPI0004F5033F|nr:PREDICTED: mitochondrial inner membrane protease subunit 1 isoform X2 [Pygoscelis adeliae]
MAFISLEHWQLKCSLKCFINYLNNKESLQMYFKNCVKNYTLSKTEETKIVDKTFQQKEVSLIGDIVIVKSPNDPKSNICKRVIGLEGDKVCTSNPSDFLKSHSYVPKGHVWLEGDNLRNSTDSRCYGPVPYGLIRGRICFKIWPLNDFGFLRASPNGHRFLDD